MGDAQCRHKILRVRRIRSRPGEIAAALGAVLGGLALIAGIVLVDPRWQKILDSWRASIELPVGAGLGPRAIRPDGFEVQQPTVSVREATPRPGRAQSDYSTQIMANLLVSELGQDPAWRTAMANADAHTADSPEQAYWHGVAAAIRDGGHRPRP
jgi:hypothetical protein